MTFLEGGGGEIEAEAEADNIGDIEAEAEAAATIFGEEEKEAEAAAISIKARSNTIAANGTAVGIAGAVEELGATEGSAVADLSRRS
jgi:hypothetical protein